MPKRKGRACANEAPNLKRFREDVTDLVYESALKTGMTSGAPTSVGAKSKTGSQVLNRKEKRRQLKKDKKQGKEIVEVKKKKNKKNAKDQMNNNETLIQDS